jgi:hypothetical protein
VLAVVVCLFLGVPLLTMAVGLLFHFDRSALTGRQLWAIPFVLGFPCAALWLHVNMMKSLRIEMEDDRITGIQNHPFSHSPRAISFVRHEIRHIRAGRHSALYIHGRNSNGRWIDLYIPAWLENYDDLRLAPDWRDFFVSTSGNKD